MMKLGIIGAMDEEVETLIHNIDDLKKTELVGGSYYEGVLNALPVVVVKCGIGKVNAAICAQQLCSVFGITHMVNTGIAGSLSNERDIGDLVVSRDAMYHDFDCTHFGYSIGQVPGTGEAAFTADDRLMALAFTAADSIHPGRCCIGRIASGDQFINSREQKEKIVLATKAVCTEMEGAAIAHTAWRNTVPFVIIRAISDKADDSAQMDYPAFEKMAAHRCAEVVMDLAARLAEDEAENE